MATKYDVKSSPFVELQTPFTAYEAFKVALLLPLMVARLLVCVVVISIIALINTAAAWGVPLDKPLSKQRRGWVLISKELFVVVLWMLGFKVTVKGRQHIKKAEELGSVIVFNHVSYVDAPAVMWLLAPSGVGKSSVSNIPILKHVVKAYQAVYFHESKKPSSAPANPAAAAAAAGKAVAYVVSGSVTEVLLKRVSEPSYGKPGGYPMVCMAPEGTCSNGRALIEFRTGAFVLARPVLPVCLKYKIRTHNPAWTQVASEPWHLTRLMCQWYNELDITILPPYVPSEVEKADPKLYAAHVRQTMADALGVPAVPHSHAHYMALKKAGVVVNWRGDKLLAKKGVDLTDGVIDLEKYGFTQ